jgi:hypothetical protein
MKIRKYKMKEVETVDSKLLTVMQMVDNSSDDPLMPVSLTLSPSDRRYRMGITQY